MLLISRAYALFASGLWYCHGPEKLLTNVWWINDLEIYLDLKANVHFKVDPTPTLSKLQETFPSPKECAQCCPLSVGVKLQGTLRETKKSTQLHCTIKGDKRYTCHRCTNISFMKTALLILFCSFLAHLATLPSFCTPFYRPQAQVLIPGYHESWAMSFVYTCVTNKWRIGHSFPVKNNLSMIWLSWLARLQVEVVLGGRVVCDMVSVRLGRSGYWHLNH